MLVLKNPNKNNKGILILTHKEGKIYPLISKFRKYYLVGNHIGGNLRNDTPRVLRGDPDFILTSLNQIPDDFPRKDLVIELNSRNFLPDHFDICNKDRDYLLKSIDEMHKFSKHKINDRHLKKIQNGDDTIWDILWVNKPHKVKKMDKFMQQLRKLFTEYGPKDTLLLSANNDLELKYKADHTDFVSMVNQNFTEEEKRYISILRPHTDGPHGVANKYVAPFYHWSNIFCFYTISEGESRVVHEALCAGCPVVYYKNVEGSSNDYLDDTNSFGFDDYDNSYSTIIEALKSDKEYDFDKIRKICLSKYSINILKEKLIPFYKKIGQKFDGKLNDIKEMSMELPAHNKDVPWRDPDKVTGDLSPRKFNVFVNKSSIMFDDEGNKLDI